MDNNDDSFDLPDGETKIAEPEKPREIEELAKKQKNKTDKNKKNGGGLKSHWAVKATVLTFFLSAFFSFLSQLAETADNVYVVLILLVFLIIGSIVTDGIGVAVAACEIGPLTAMASRKVYGSKMAIKLVKNAEVVSNICNDVIGDIFGILAGACSVVIVARLVVNASSVTEQIVTIAISSVVSAAIVGGKAFLKNYAINRSKDFVMATARFLTLFTKERKSARRK